MATDGRTTILSTTNYMLIVLCTYISTEKGGIQFQGYQKRQDIKKKSKKKKLKELNAPLIMMHTKYLLVYSGYKRDAAKLL